MDSPGYRRARPLRRRRPRHVGLLERRLPGERVRPRALRARARDARCGHASTRDRRPGDLPAALLRHGRPAEPDGRMHFAARDDMFLPGFFAGFPPELPLRARRLLYGSASRAGFRPSTSSRSAARTSRGGGGAGATRAAARRPALRGEGRRVRGAGRACGLPPARAAEALRGEYADLLWQPFSPEDGAGLEEFWSAEPRRRPHGDFPRLVEIVRDGNVLDRLPGGTPLAGRRDRADPPGIGALVRRGKPAAVRPLAIAYDPLVRGRTRVHLALGAPAQLPKDDVEGALLALLRVTMPLTCGQVVASRLRGRRGRPFALERDLRTRSRWRARRVGRSSPTCTTAGGRRAAPREALAVAPRRARAAVPRPRVRERAGAQPDSCAGSRRRPSRRGNAGLTRIAPMSVTGMTASACIVRTYAVALSGLTSMPFAARRVR